MPFSIRQQLIQSNPVENTTASYQEDCHRAGTEIIHRDCCAHNNDSRQRL